MNGNVLAVALVVPLHLHLMILFDQIHCEVVAIRYVVLLSEQRTQALTVLAIGASDTCLAIVIILVFDDIALAIHAIVFGFLTLELEVLESLARLD